MLLPRSDRGLPALSQGLSEMGYDVTDLAVYANRANPAAAKQDLTTFTKIRFASPSGVEAFKQMYGKLPEGIPLVSKGRTTGNKLKEEI